MQKKLGEKIMSDIILSYKKGSLDRSGREIDKIFYKNDSDWIIYSIKGDYTSVYKESQDSKIPHSPEMQRIFTQIEQEEPKILNRMLI